MTQFDVEITDCVNRHAAEPDTHRALSLLTAALALADYAVPNGIDEDDFAEMARITHRRVRKALRSGASA